MSKPLTFYAHNHQGKADVYIDALLSAYGRVERTDAVPFPEVDFVLADNDVRGRRSLLNRLRKAGAKQFFIYPHGARPNLVNDLRATWEFTTAHFVATEGHAEIMRRYGYPKPIHVVGWSLCPLRPFRRKKRVRKVLFAPIHHRCAEIDQELNRLVFNKLFALVEADEIDLAVRYVGPFYGSGLEHVEHRRIEYTAGESTPGWGQIDNADVVVAHQTFAYIAVARGIPTVMMGEDMPTHLCPANRSPLFVPNWDKYADLLAYPLDIAHTDDPLALMHQAAESDADIAEWRKRMIGKPFDAGLFLDAVGEYLSVEAALPEPRSKRQGRGSWWIVNHHGTVHQCDKEHAKKRVRQDGYRMATDQEIALSEAQQFQTFDRPIGQKG